MISLALALPFLAFPGAADADEPALPASLRLEEAPQGQEEERLRPEAGPMPVMEYLYRYSELEAGMLYTDWGGDLRMDSRLGFYVRWGVGIVPNVTANITFRYYDFDNSEITGAENEHILARSLLLGAGVRYPLTSEIAVTGNAAVGLMRFDSRAATIGSDTGPAFSAEGALTVRLWEALGFKAGVAVDLVRTDFHQSSADTVLSLSYLVGFEWGM